MKVTSISVYDVLNDEEVNQNIAYFAEDGNEFKVVPVVENGVTTKFKVICYRLK